MDYLSLSRSFSSTSRLSTTNPVGHGGFIQQDFPPPRIVSPQAGVFHPGPLQNIQQQAQSNLEVLPNRIFLPYKNYITPQTKISTKYFVSNHEASNHPLSEAMTSGRTYNFGYQHWDQLLLQGTGTDSVCTGNGWSRWELVPVPVPGGPKPKPNHGTPSTHITSTSKIKHPSHPSLFTIKEASHDMPTQRWHLKIKIYWFAIFASQRSCKIIRMSFPINTDAGRTHNFDFNIDISKMMPGHLQSTRMEERHTCLILIWIFPR